MILSKMSHLRPINAKSGNIEMIVDANKIVEATYLHL